MVSAYAAHVGVRRQGWGVLPPWRRAIAVLLAVAAVAFIVVVVGMFLRDSHARDSGQLAIARVLDVHWALHVSTADVQFVTRDGTPVSAKLDLLAAEGSPERGDRIEVRYRPEDPAGTVVVAHVDRVSYWLVVAPSVSILASVGAWPAYRAVEPALRPPAKHLAPSS
jgi:hypothetical protein